MESRKEFNGKITRSKERICASCEEIFHNTSPYAQRLLCEECNPPKTNGHYVYYLPKEHYVGVTDSPSRRWRSHLKEGKDIKGARILYHNRCRGEAELVEAQFHIILGCEGAVYKKKRI